MSDQSVVISLITSGTAFLGTIVSVVPRLRRQSQHLEGIRDQVANSHGTNLRDDLDFIRDIVLDVRTDVAWVRRDHLDLTDRVKILERK